MGLVDFYSKELKLVKFNREVLNQYIQFALTFEELKKGKNYYSAFYLKYCEKNDFEFPADKLGGALEDDVPYRLCPSDEA